MKRCAWRAAGTPTVRTRISRINLPFGSLHMSAFAFMKTGTAFGHAGSEDVRVTGG